MRSTREREAQIDKTTGNQSSVELMLGDSKVDGAMRYLGADIEDTLSLSEEFDNRRLVCRSALSRRSSGGDAARRDRPKADPRTGFETPDGSAKVSVRELSRLVAQGELLDLPCRCPWNRREHDFPRHLVGSQMSPAPGAQFLGIG